MSSRSWRPEANPRCVGETFFTKDRSFRLAAAAMIPTSEFFAARGRNCLGSRVHSACPACSH
eukprot:4966061-Pyramimonas_sp.AAC.1